MIILIIPEMNMIDYPFHLTSWSLFFIEKNKRNKINHISHVGLSLFKDNAYIFKNKVYLFIYVNYVNLL